MQAELKKLEAQIQNNSQSPAPVAFEQPREEANPVANFPGDELDSSPNLTEGAGIRYE